MFRIKFLIGSNLRNPFTNRRLLGGVGGLNNTFEIEENQEDLQLLRSTCEKVQKEVVQSPSPILTQWLNKIVTHTIPSPRLSRPRAAFRAFKVSCTIEPSKSLREKAACVAWAVDFAMAHILFIDDILDNSLTRRNKPCWHTLPEVGRSAANDACFLRSAAFQIIRSHLSEHLAYNDLLQLFSTKIREIEYGQMLDQIALKQGKEGNYELFTVEFYRQRNNYMASPFAQITSRAGMLTAGVVDPKIHSGSEDILGDIGFYFQAENDYLDVFGPDYSVSKNGSDITEGKCSWLAVESLPRMSRAQKKLFQMHFGHNDQQSKTIVEKLYRELRMDEVFHQMTQEFKGKTMTKINTFCTDHSLNPEIFYSSLRILTHLFKDLKTN